MSKADLTAWGRKMRERRFRDYTAEERSDLARKAALARWAGHKPKKRRMR